MTTSIYRHNPALDTVVERTLRLNAEIVDNALIEGCVGQTALLLVHPTRLEEVTYLAGPNEQLDPALEFNKERIIRPLFNYYGAGNPDENRDKLRDGWVEGANWKGWGIVAKYRIHSLAFRRLFIDMPNLFDEQKHNLGRITELTVGPFERK